MSDGALEGYDDEETTATELHVKPRTLRKWRAEGVGPPYVKVARQFYYSRAGRIAWLKSLEVHPPRSAGRAA
jgi:hypothetical protein